MSINLLRKVIGTGILLVGFTSFLSALAQPSKSGGQSIQPTLGLERGVLIFRAGNFQLQLMKASQTVAALLPDTLKSFDFTPRENLQKRSGNGSYHLGDINLRLRLSGDSSWHSFSTATNRSPVTALAVTGDILAGADLTPTLPAGIPVIVKRYWEKAGNDLVLRFVLKNKSDTPVEIGGLGMPVIFDNILRGRTLEAAHAKNVFYDPYIGMDAGYLQVTRLNGQSPSLLVLPYGKTPFEAYNPLLNDPLYRDVTFEGFYEWEVYSKAFVDREWNNTEPWNVPHSAILKPGESRSVGLRFVLSGKPEDIQSRLVATGHPVAVGIPGYVIPQDVDARLFLKYGHQIKSLTVFPRGALSLVKMRSTVHQWKAYGVKGKRWGRARVTITYSNGLVQTVNYKVIKPERNVVKDYGQFLNTKQWFDKPDAFHRNPSYITYDYELKKPVTEDERVWVAGLSDEAGAGSWLGASMKQTVLPDKAEIAQLESFVDSTLWGGIQYKEGPQQYGVRKSLFYYDPANMPQGTYNSSVNYKTWGAWKPKEAGSVGRSYNYPHVAAAYWALYRIARYHPGLVTHHEWQWYLTHAYETVMGMVRLSPAYTQFGQMEGSVFCFILEDLKREGLSDLAVPLEDTMKKRAIHWHSLQYPFGSEMPWDSTGQEEVYVWSWYFGFFDKAQTTLSAILAYMPVIPNWAYNGNARRYWDFGTAGKISRVERMIHHYGSGLNAIPVLAAYRQNPRNFYLLQVGYAGLMGSIANINQKGFAPCAFHSFPQTMDNDAYSGDYGSGFYGYSVNSATYVFKHPEFGWLTFGGNIKQSSNNLEIRPTTAAQSRIFIADAGIWLNFAAGTVEKLTYNVASKQIVLTLKEADAHTPVAFFTVEHSGPHGPTGYTLSRGAVRANGQYQYPLMKERTTRIVLTPINTH